MKKISIKDFGKDHWSLLAYVETRCVDYKGVLDKEHLRLKNKVHEAGSSSIWPRPSWKPEYGTRLSGYFLEGKELNTTRQLPNHDDLDCLEDLENTGLIENIGSGLFPAEKMTKYGREIASKLRQHKADGEMYATFSIN